MSQLRTWAAKRAAKIAEGTNPNTDRDYTLAIVQKKIPQGLPTKEILRQMRKLRITVRN